METYLFVFLLLIVSSSAQTCERCVCPCSQSYCLSDSSNTWNSSFSYASYGYTKLVLGVNGSACSPCAYSCQVIICLFRLVHHNTPHLVLSVCRDSIIIIQFVKYVPVIALHALSPITSQSVYHVTLELI